MMSFNFKMTLRCWSSQYCFDLKNVRKLYLLYLYLLIKQHNRHKWGLLFVLLSNKYWCYWRGTSVGYLLSSNFNPMRSTCQLVKWNILSFIEPIRESVRKVVSCASLWGTVVKALSLLASQMNNLWCQPIRIYVRRPMMLSCWVKDVFMYTWYLYVFWSDIIGLYMKKQHISF